MQPQEGGAGEILANLSVGHIVLAALVLTILRLLLLPHRAPAIRQIAELLESLLVAGVLVFLIIRPFIMQAFFIPSESMEPTLQGHRKGWNEGTATNYQDEVFDHIFVNKMAYRIGEPQQDDIIVFRAPKEADKQSIAQGRSPVENVLIKRLIGVPNDTIDMKPDDKGIVRMWRNGKPLNEPFINEPMISMADRSDLAVNFPLHLGQDELFVMGDNRNHSNDSRFWGVLKRNRVIGKAMFIFWPLKRLGIIH